MRDDGGERAHRRGRRAGSQVPGPGRPAQSEERVVVRRRRSPYQARPRRVPGKFPTVALGGAEIGQGACTPARIGGRPVSSGGARCGQAGCIRALMARSDIQRLGSDGPRDLPLWESRCSIGSGLHTGKGRTAVQRPGVAKAVYLPGRPQRRPGRASAARRGDRPVTNGPACSHPERLAAVHQLGGRPVTRWP